MGKYMDGYRDGYKVARVENSEQVYESQCSAIEHKLSQLAAKIQRTSYSLRKSDMREYVSLSQYFLGFCQGYTRAKSDDGSSGG